MTPPTEEEKRMQVMRFLSQKREQFSISVLCSLLNNNPGVRPDDVVAKAVGIADLLLERLYPLKDEGKGEDVREAAEE